MVTFQAISDAVWNGWVNYVFGNPFIGGMFIIIFILALEFKLGMTSDVIVATACILLVSFGAVMLPFDFSGIVYIAVGLMLGIVLYKMMR